MENYEKAKSNPEKEYPMQKIINKLTKNVTVESFSDTHIMEHTKKKNYLKREMTFIGTHNSATYNT